MHVLPNRPLADDLQLVSPSFIPLDEEPLPTAAAGSSPSQQQLPDHQAVASPLQSPVQSPARTRSATRSLNALAATLPSAHPSLLRTGQRPLTCPCKQKTFLLHLPAVQSWVCDGHSNLVNDALAAL